MKNDYAGLLNVFALLSIVAVGGGSAVIPQMEHETVTLRQWITPQEFATVFSLGQVAPGPNMSMVALIGYKVGGFIGALIALVAFYFPACMLAYVASHVWDACKDSPWRDSVQEGLAPITIGLMLAGVYAVGKTASYNVSRTLEDNLITLAIGAAVAIILFLRNVNPALLILMGGVAGYLFLR